MRKSRKYVLPAFALLVASAPVFSQTALQRSTELCAAMQPIAADNGRKFEVIRPGACRVSIDTGYFLYVSNFDRFLHLSLGVDADRTGLFGPQASAYMLHLRDRARIISHWKEQWCSSTWGGLCGA